MAFLVLQQQLLDVYRKQIQKKIIIWMYSCGAIRRSALSLAGTGTVPEKQYGFPTETQIEIFLK